FYLFYVLSCYHFYLTFKGCVHAASVPSVVQRQNDIFNVELAKCHSKIGRIEKIEVQYNGTPEPCKLMMNKNISTPYNVAQHINEWTTKHSALALVNKNFLWDMHRALDSDCELQFLKFTDSDPFYVNKAFWRTCSFLLGAVIQEAFSSHITVTLHSFPSPNVASGSFIYDASLNLEDWKPSLDELRTLSAHMMRLSQKEWPIERLEVTEKVATEIFADNRFKLEQIPGIASSQDGKLTLYRVGSHIDISKGPMVGNSSFVGRCSITGVHQIESNDGRLFRFQGVALPKGILLNHFAYRILEDRASKLVSQSINI
ncbi:hypothetical protein AAG570_013458, partial [Ranatra chinensis]